MKVPVAQLDSAFASYCINSTTLVDTIVINVGGVNQGEKAKGRGFEPHQGFIISFFFSQYFVT